MKNLKFNFITIVALLSASITLGMHASFLKKGKIAPYNLANCYTNITYSDPGNCFLPPITINAVCEVAKLQEGKPVFSFTLPIEPETCFLGGPNFCCATIRAVATPICGKSNVIDQVFCTYPASPSSPF